MQKGLSYMLKWIHKHGGAIETLVAQGGTRIAASEAALTALLYNHTIRNTACVKAAYLCSISNASMTLLGCLTSVTKVVLRGHPAWPYYTDFSLDPLGAPHTDQRPVDLDPLQGLPALTSLALTQGSFHGLGALKHLTSVFVIESHVL